MLEGDLLAGSPLLAGATPDELARLLGDADRRVLRRDQVLFRKGDPADSLVLVVEGTLRIVSTSRWGEALVLTSVPTGGIVGTVGVIDGGPRSATVVAATETRILCIRGETYRAVLDSSPTLARAAATDIALRLRELTESAADRVFLDLPRRLAKLLVADQDEIVTLAQYELAQHLGVTRSTVSRALTTFVQRGWVVTARGRVRVIDREALRTFGG